MASDKKLSQQQLRQLMREKAQSKTPQRIESPLAKYDEKGSLWCVLCNVVVHSESLWTSHLNEKAHKKKIDELKQLRLKANNPVPEIVKESGNGLKKRKAPSKGGDFPSKTASKFDRIAEFSKKEISIKQSKPVTGTVEDKPVDSVESLDEDVEALSGDTAPIVAGASLPQDFFDDGVKPAPAPIQSNNIKRAVDGINPSAESDTKPGTLPKGFFDDPLLDAKSRKPKGVPFKDPFEEQMELFRKEIAQESIVSEIIMEDEIEQVQKEKNISEIEDQIENWEKVEDYQKRIEQIHKKREHEKTATGTRDEFDDEQDNDDEEEEDLNDMNFWRNKGVFH